MKDGHERCESFRSPTTIPTGPPAAPRSSPTTSPGRSTPATGCGARFLAASTSLQEPDAAPGSLRAHGDDLVLQTGAYDRFSMTRLDGTDWIAALGGVLDRLRPDVVHLHGLDRIGAEVLAVIRRLAPRCRIVLTLHDYQLICPNDGLLLTTGEGARCRAARPDRCRRCFPEQSAARHALRKAHLLALLEAVDLFVAPSAFLRERFVDWGLDAATHPAAAERGGACRRLAATAAGGRGATASASSATSRGTRGRWCCSTPRRCLKDAAADLRVSLHGGLGWAEAELPRRLRGEAAPPPSRWPSTSGPTTART